MKRRATHAGSWYLGDGDDLDIQLTEFLDNVPSASTEHGPFPVPGARIIIAPHAGYSYSGPTAAWAYKAWDVSGLKRVFLLGPSHHVYLKSCALSQCTEYETPLGNIPIDTETIEKLHKGGEFQMMSKSTDEDEHSLEMHLPYIYKILSSSKEGMRPLVPIMVGSLSAKMEREFGEILGPYLADPANGFVVSSDFCHWGSRFGFTNYVEDADCSRVRSLSGSNQISSDMPIYKSIEIMDYKGMEVASRGSHAEWTTYLSRTKNTICGRHPIGVVIAGIEALREAGVGESDDKSTAEPAGEEDAQKDQFGKIYWVQYNQSSHCKRLSDSSVSYASGFAKA
ncbi:MEMO1 family [Myxozyma melibiosi]|uniref:MEMO1 family n=1 Tax=Myxozyma melibiosi TaxID=54550 RepID=A0ABR1F5A8_9ASCO